MSEVVHVIEPVVRVVQVARAVGIKGDRGPTGPRGEQGPQGLTGPRGDQGEPGPTGLTGPKGDIGPQGVEGPEGPQGIEGPRGEKGDRGSVGPAGPVGMEWRGDWSPTVDYINNDAIFHQGSSWFASGDPVLGEIPSDDAPHWWPLAIRGEVGPLGPQGNPGEQGPRGAEGPAGAPGPGVPTGGTPGQVLGKSGAGDFEASWVDPPESGWTRQTTTRTTAPLVVGAHETGLLPLAPSYRLLRVATDKPARVRFYTTPAKRDADLDRAIGAKPTGDHGRIGEFITTSELPGMDCSPLVDGQVAAGTSSVPFSIVNTGTAGTITLTLTWIRTE